MDERYCDFNNGKIINYISEFKDKYYGVDLIKRVYMDIKNSIYYDPYSKEQKASETLVMRRGDSFSKNVLLYTVLKSLEFKCTLETVRVKDNTNKFISRKKEPIDWFYISIDFFGRSINLDCAFDKDHVRALKLISKGDFGEFSVDSYYIEGEKLFEVIDKKTTILCDNNRFNLVKSNLNINCV